MADKRCFVQFPHPGDEQKPPSGCDWNRLKDDHGRKFMQLRGEWIEGDGTRRSGDLWAWGEWEPESYLIRKFNPQDGDSQHPRFLWRPYYIPKDNYQGLHNTDPFIFGERFLYSNCGQTSPKKAGLRHLGQGSVIAFGSGKKIDGAWRWMLDTVLVVRDFVDYDVPDARVVLEDWAPTTFLEVTGGPLTDSGECAPKSCAPTSTQLRLYRGATPNDPIHGMFSFFPAMPAGGDTGFPRPLVDLADEYFNLKLLRAPKGLPKERTCVELFDLWERLVTQVRDAGLVLGTHAELPERCGDRSDLAALDHASTLQDQSHWSSAP